MNVILQFPIYLCAAIKEALSRLKLLKGQNHLIIFVSIALTLLLYQPIILVLLILCIYKLLIILYLHHKYKNRFVGAMEGIDAICCNQDKCVISLLLFVEFKSDVKELQNAVVEQVRIAMKTNHEKLFYSRGECMGFHFFYREDVAAEMYVEMMTSTGKVFLSKEGLFKSILQYDMDPLPCSNQKLFQVLICPQRIRLQKCPDNNHIYCVVYRIHHCVGDGRSIMHLFLGVFADRTFREVPIEKTKEPTSDKFRMPVKNPINYFTNVRIHEFPIGVTDKNPLRGYKLCEEKNLAWFADVKSECMEKIRRIKKAVDGSKILDVINTCLSSSLHDYYVKKGLVVPKDVVAGIVLLPETCTFSLYGTQDFNLTNRFSVVSFKLPINVEGNNQLMARFQMARREYKLVRTSLDVQFNYFIGQNLFNIIPAPITRWLANFLEVTIGVSYLPGCNSFTILGHKPVKDIVLLLPNSPGTGLHIIIYTYNDGIRIALTVDKSVICNYDDCQEIVDRMVLYLKTLNDKCCHEANRKTS